VVQFETAEAARQALAAAAAVKSAAGAASSGDAGGMEVAGGAARVGGSSADGQLLGGRNVDGRGVQPVRGFSGGWLVDLLHAAVHSSIVGSMSTR
jgi:hypothetical protein